MSLVSTFELCSFIIAQQFRQKTKRRGSIIQRRLGAELLEVRAMMDGDPYQQALDDYNAAITAAQSDFATAQTGAQAAWQSTVDDGQSTLDGQEQNVNQQAATDDDTATQTLQTAVDSANNTAREADAQSDQTALNSEQAADAAAGQTISTADQQDDNDNAVNGAAYNSTQAADLVALQNTQSSDQSQYDNTVAADQSQHDANVANDVSAFNTRVNADETAMASTATAQENILQSETDSAATARDAAIGSNVPAVDPNTVANDPGFQAAEQALDDSFDSKEAAAQQTHDNACQTAANTEASAEQSALGTFNASVATGQTTFNTSQQAAIDQYNSGLEGAQNTLNAALADHAATYAQNAQAAQNQYNSDLQTAADKYASDAQAANDAYDSSAQGAQDTYNDYVTRRTAQYNADVAARNAQLASDLQTAQDNYNSAMAPNNAIDASQDQAAVDAYNNAVAGFSQTQSQSDSAAFQAESGTLAPASQAEQQAETDYINTVNDIYSQAEENGTSPDQGALDAAWATLLAARHTFANAQASADTTLVGSLGADAVQFETDEEGAYRTEEDAIDTNDGTLMTQDAGATDTLQNAIDDARSTCDADLANLAAVYSNDILSQYQILELALAGSEDTRERAIELATSTQDLSGITAWQTEQSTLNAAAQQQAHDDAVSQAAFGNQTIPLFQTEDSQLAAAAKQFEHDRGVALIAFDGQMEAAMAQQATDNAAADAAEDNAIATASESYVDDLAQAWAATLINMSGGDSQTTAFANAWSAYWQTVAADNAAAISNIDSADLNILPDELSAWSDITEQEAGENMNLAGQVASAPANQISLDDAAEALYDGQVISAALALMQQEINSRKSDIDQEIGADVTDMRAYDAAQLQQGYDHADHSLTWAQTVIPVAISVQQTLNTEDAALWKTMDQDEDDFLHTEDGADESYVQNLVGPAETAMDQALVARKTYLTTVAQDEAADAKTAATANAAFVASEPDSAFASGVPADSADFQLALNEPDMGQFAVQNEVQKKQPALFIPPGTYGVGIKYPTSNGYFVLYPDASLSVFSPDGTIISTHPPAAETVKLNFVTPNFARRGFDVFPVLASVTVLPQTRPNKEQAGETADVEVEAKTDPYEGSTDFQCGAWGPLGPGLFLRQRRVGAGALGGIPSDFREPVLGPLGGFKY
ncbi:MAG TPA: hypothetical protein VF278_08810 [Pirellulales bacterium]